MFKNKIKKSVFNLINKYIFFTNKFATRHDHSSFVVGKFTH